jgi:tetratricopeptide (TPR) repeat protein
MKKNHDPLPVPKFISIKKLFRNKLHVAYTTTLFLALLSWLTMKPTPEKLFRESYHHYEVPVMRGSSATSSMKEEYNKGKNDSVIMEFNSLNSPQPEEYLLAGIAYLESNQPEKAIETLNTLIQKNTDANTDYFQDDAEYYLGMSYLSNQQFEKAFPIFEKIQADTENPYNSTVSEWFLLKMKTIAKK